MRVFHISFYNKKEIYTLLSKKNIKDIWNIILLLDNARILMQEALTKYLTKYIITTIPVYLFVLPVFVETCMAYD